MTARTANSFLLAVLLHGALIGVAWWLAAMFNAPAMEWTPPAAPVFEIVPGVSGENSSSGDRTAAAANAPSVKLILPPRPVVRAVEPTREAETPLSAATSAAPTVARTHPAPARMSYQQFQQTHRTASSSAAKNPMKAATQAKTPHIDLGEILASEGGARDVARGGGSEIDAYLARLLRQLNDTYVRPAGLDAGWQARVEFALRPDGTIASARIAEGSGNAEFDASVLACFRQLRALDAPPAGAAGQSYRVLFRMRAAE